MKNSVGSHTVFVRRQWNDTSRIAEVLLKSISGLHLSDVSGGVRARAPRKFLHGYINCNDIIRGDLAHSCRHGRPPHSIKVCIVKKDNTSEVISYLEAVSREKAEKGRR